jgi:MFS family permease
MPETDEAAFRFASILASELAEITKRRAITAEARAAGAATAPSETNRPEELFPRRKGIAKPAAPPQDVVPAQTESQGERETEPAVPVEAPKDTKTTDDDSIQQANDNNLLGLAFSGGGIRSATFNLGILQGLAKFKLVQRVDYLSTISGGGYIGAWLTAWIYRRGVHEVERRLGAERKNQPHFKDPPEIGFLREYSNYLTPRKGFLGADTWTAIAIYLRNLLLNQLVLILFIAGILLAPRGLTMFVQKPPQFLSCHPFLPWIVSLLLLVMVATYAVFANMRNYTIGPRPDRVLGRVQTVENSNKITVDLFKGDTEPEVKELLSSRFWVEVWDPTITIRRNLAAGPQRCSFAIPEGTTRGTITFESPVSAEPGDRVIVVYPAISQSKWIVPLIVAPIFISATIIACAIAHFSKDPNFLTYAKVTSPLWWIVAGSSTYSALWLLIFLLRPNLDKLERGMVRKSLSVVFTALSPVIAGAAGGLLLWRFATTLEDWNTHTVGMWRILGFGGPIVALIFLASTVIQMGLLSVVFSEPRREWWGRLAAVLLTICFGWIAAFALAGYAPLWLLRFSQYPKSSWLAAIAWVGSTALGILGGKSEKAGAIDSRTWKDVALSITPYIFIVGLLMLVSLGIHEALSPTVPGAVSQSAPQTTAVEVSGSGQRSLQAPGNTTLQLKITERQTTKVLAEPYWKSVESSLTSWVYYAFAICLGASFLLALRFDLNEFSMHYLYRNRLVRCYLGASHRERVANPFTGFDGNDDIYLASLTAEHSYDGPFPIFGAALNLVHGKDLAWQERKAESFIMTPLFCGFDVWFERFARPGTWDKRGLDPFGYRITNDYAYPGGFYVGTAMAISGAAASPNMGYHSSPALGFLMTVFNVRLGWWVGNPRHRTAWKSAGPLIGLGYLLAELFGETDDEGKYVYLSDGGHFENLGLYELVKRRCRFIIASDAGADKDLAFGDLASAIRKCRSDMGIDIKMRTDTLAAVGTPAFSKWHCAVGDILYANSDRNAKNGILLYIKASLTADESSDVLNYKTQHSSFPHQSTADQWFTESQFESYRALGEHIIQSVFQAITADKLTTLDTMNFETMFKAFGDFWKNSEEIKAIRWPVNTGP